MENGYKLVLIRFLKGSLQGEKTYYKPFRNGFVYVMQNLSETVLERCLMVPERCLNGARKFSKQFLMRVWKPIENHWQTIINGFSKGFLKVACAVKKNYNKPFGNGFV